MLKEKLLKQHLITSRRIIVLILLFCIVQSTLGRLEVQASNPSNVMVGAIRWDGYTGDALTFGENYIGLGAETAMSPAKFQYRIPFYSTKISQNSVKIRNTTQSSMDSEIAYAKNAKIDYWAFCWYRADSGLDIARNLYLSSSYKDDVKWSAVLTNVHYDTTQEDYLVGLMKETNYQKVLNGRPLVYIFYYNLSQADLDSLRDKCNLEGVADPYVVVMDFSASAAAQKATDCGADAISTYATPISNGDSYASAMSNEQTQWNNYKDTGKKIVPFVTTGWDNRPYNYNNGTDYYPDPGMDSWGQNATPTEIGNQLQDALTWVSNNSSTAEANAVIMYGWNEFTEGGWIVPTLYFGADRLNAIASVLGGSQQTTNTPPSLGTNLAIGATASASSSLGSGYEANKAIDGNATGTMWASSSGAGAGSWLEIDFGSSTTFNTVVLRELSLQRIKDYRIQYYNGTSWIDVYSGTFAGVYCPVSFTTVTAAKVRVYIDSIYINTPAINELEVYNIANLDASLVHEWKFDSNQFDEYGGTHGALINGATFSEYGKSNQTIILDGTNDYVHMSDAINLDGFSNFSVSCWVNMSSLPDSGMIYIPIGKDKNTELSYRIEITSDGTGRFVMATTNNAWDTAGTSASFTALSTDTWYHIVGTYDGSYVRVYTNGSLAGTGSQAISGALVSKNSPLHFGSADYKYKVDNTSEDVTYTGTWTAYNNPSLYGGSVKYTNSTWNYALHSFTGTGIEVGASKAYNRGKADVYIDGVLDTTNIDLYDATGLTQQIVYSKSGLSYGSHYIQFVCNGTKNASSSGYYIDIDFFQPSTFSLADSFEGKIDEVRIYQKGLSAAEVYALYNSY